MLYLLIAVAIFGVDMYMKQHIEKTKELGHKEMLFGKKVILRKAHNTGAMLNLMEKKQAFVAKFSLGVSIVLAIYYLWLLMRKGNSMLKLGLSFLIGGAGSNVYDRFKRKYVVDYFSFNVKWEKLRNIVFNLADIFIFAGALIVVLAKGFRQDKAT